MTKIRKLYYFDNKNTKEMISFLDNGDTCLNRILFNPFTLLHYFLPLRFKHLPESYVLKDRNELKGVITIAPTRCPLKQMEIQKLLFEENCYDDAEELVQYVVSRYKAMGAASIIVRINDYLPDLIKMFISKCGFSQISYEKLWGVNLGEGVNNFEQVKNSNRKDDSSKYDPRMFREFRNSDAPVIANLYNEQLLPHFRTLLGKNAKDFRDSLFPGLSYYSEYKYVYRDRKSKNILAYISIKTSDNKNYILDVVQSYWNNVDLDSLIFFAADKVLKRKNDAKLFIKTKKYTQQGEKIEKDFIDKKFECVQNQIVLTNSSAKIIKEGERVKRYTVLDQFLGGVSVVNKSRV